MTHTPYAPPVPFRAVYYDGKQSISHKVSVEQKTYGLKISGPELHEQVTWKLESIYVQERPKHGRAGKLGNSELPDAQLLIEEPERFRSIIASLPQKKRKGFDHVLATRIGALAVLVLALVFWGIPMLAVQLVDFVPESWEQKLGKAAHAHLVGNRKVCSTPEGDKALQVLTKKLTYPNREGKTVKVSVVDDPMVNALAAPGGYIIFFRGLIEEAESPEEVAGVLAHEMGHVEYRHGTEGLIRHGMAAMVIDVITGGGGTALYIAAQLIEMEYSKDAEREADLYALQMLQYAKVSPAGFAAFFERMDKKNADSKVSKLLEGYFSTHPVPKERAEMVHQAEKTVKNTVPALSPAEWKALKGICGRDASPKITPKIKTTSGQKI